MNVDYNFLRRCSPNGLRAMTNTEAYITAQQHVEMQLVGVTWSGKPDDEATIWLTGTGRALLEAQPVEHGEAPTNGE